jgi:alpha-beta hydrolase superfamily lysophospholipase
MPAVEVPKPRTPTDRLFRDAEQIRVAKADQVLFKGRISLLLAATALNVGTTVWDEVGQWCAPTLVIHGTSDVAAPVETSKKFVEEIVSSDETLNLIEGGYHELLNDVNPDTIIQLILSWLEVHLD